MAIFFQAANSAEPPLLEDAVDGAVDFEGRPVTRSRSGGWRSASYIIAVEVAERFAYYGIASNLVTYLTGPLNQSTAAAAANVNAWAGTASLLPLLGAFVADAYLGRYRTIVIASLIYILGLALVTISAKLTSMNSSSCLHNSVNVGDCSPSQLLVVSFMCSIYLVAIGQGGHKPCVQAFGADQFDGRHQKESVAKSSFFNWWYFGISIGANLSVLLIVYIEDDVSWALAFGILFILMVVGLVVFLLGTRTYRYSIKGNGGNPFKRIGRVFVAAFRNRHFTTHLRSSNEEEAHGAFPQHNSEQFKCLNKALIEPDCFGEARKQCSIEDVEDAKALLRLIPIWTTCLGYTIVFAQATTFFTKQGETMDRTLTAGFKIPAASLQFFIGIAIILFIPIYDRIFVPAARAITHKPSGITMLQRIGCGISLSAISMMIAALVEMKRLKTAEEYGLVDDSTATVPMSIWWLVPQYTLFGVADVFTIVGLQEFFYDQVPYELRSMGLSFYLSVIGVGSFLSSILITVIDELSSADGGESWFASNLNQAHLDYFYWLLAGLSVVGLAGFVYFSRAFVYNRGIGTSGNSLAVNERNGEIGRLNQNDFD